MEEKELEVPARQSVIFQQAGGKKGGVWNMVIMKIQIVKNIVGLAEGDEINFPPTVGDCNDERYLVEIKSQT